MSTKDDVACAATVTLSGKVAEKEIAEELRGYVTTAVLDSITAEYAASIETFRGLTAGSTTVTRTYAYERDVLVQVALTVPFEVPEATLFKLVDRGIEASRKLVSQRVIDDKVEDLIGALTEIANKAGEGIRSLFDKARATVAKRHGL